jgi:hypothetical protein
MKRTKDLRTPFQREADTIKAESRKRVAELAAKGQGHVALAENLALLGIDVNSKERPRLVGFDGHVFRE